MNVRKSLCGVCLSVAVGGCAGGPFGGGAGGDGGADGADGASLPGLSIALRANNNLPDDADDADEAPRANGRGNARDGAEVILVRIDGIAAHYAGGAGWQTIAFDTVDVDLLRLGESSDALHLAELPEGRITQLRLFVTDEAAAHVIDIDGELHGLKIPSGSESGIKLHGPFDLYGCGAQLSLDIDGPKSIHVHGRGQAEQDWILRPVIRVGAFDGGQDCVVEPPPPGPGEGDVIGEDDGDPTRGDPTEVPGTEDPVPTEPAPTEPGQPEAGTPGLPEAGTVTDPTEQPTEGVCFDGEFFACPI